MASTERMRAYRQNDSKKNVQVRLSSETLARLDRMVSEQGASGRAEIINQLFSDDPKALGKLGSHLLRRYFRLTGRTEGTARNEQGVVDMLVRFEG